MDDKSKSIGTTKDVLQAMGQESEKEGRKWTKHFMDKFEKKEWEKDQFKLTKLRKRRKFKDQYYRMLGRMLMELMEDFEKPNRNFQVSAYCTESGVVGQLKTFGQVYQKAFKPCGIPKIDYHAVKTVAGLAEDKAYELADDIKTPGGVYLK